MKKIFILFLTIMIASAAMAQESKKEQRKAARKIRKEERAMQEAADAAVMKASIESRQFVLEANFLSNKRGERLVVQPNLNFIGVDREKGAFQFGNAQSIGYNGVGGVTVEGQIADFKIKEGKKGFLNLDFRIVSSAGNIFVNMSVSPSGNADATIRANTSGLLRYSGKVVPLGSSIVYKGSNLF